MNNLDKGQRFPSGHQLDPVLFVLMPNGEKIIQKIMHLLLGTVASIHYLTENGVKTFLCYSCTTFHGPKEQSLNG